MLTETCYKWLLLKISLCFYSHNSANPSNHRKECNIYQKSHLFCNLLLAKICISSEKKLMEFIKSQGNKQCKTLENQNELGKL